MPIQILGIGNDFIDGTNFNGSGTDPDIFYRCRNASTSTWTPTEVHGGSTYTITVTVSDGTLSDTEDSLQGYDVTFGAGYNARVHTQSNSTHMYYGVQMDNYTLGDDAFGIQLSPENAELDSDLRIANYNGQSFDGNIHYDGTWAEDSTGTNSTEFATGDNVIEFIIRLQSPDPQDVRMFPGMNYQLKFLWWDNVDYGEPSFTSNWNTFWVPVQLY